ncbi:MAG: DUF418 domain-containing protein [Chloroflexota bacterium]|nr:DUF418 domain-containing protein [Chloroflexota bacterium]
MGVPVLTVALAEVSVGRSMLLIFFVGVRAAQFRWSHAWLSRFRFGPAEWLWPVATYCRWQPLLRS